MNNYEKVCIKLQSGTHVKRKTNRPGRLSAGAAIGAGWRYGVKTRRWWA